MFKNVNKASGDDFSNSLKPAGNDFLLLDLTFKTELLEADYNKVSNAEWVPHFQRKDYNGNWDALALYSESGNQSAVFTEQRAPQRTEILNYCKYFDSVCKSFDAPILSARILILKAGSEIKEHTDYKASYADGIMRIHIPIVTDANVLFLINGKRVEMKPGECWYGNFSLPHSVTHSGATDRVHIVIDLERNEWTDALMKKSGYDFTLEGDKLPIEVVRRMINELELSHTPSAAGIVNQLKEQYGI